MIQVLCTWNVHIYCIYTIRLNFSSKIWRELVQRSAVMVHCGAVWVSMYVCMCKCERLHVCMYLCATWCFAARSSAFAARSSAFASRYVCLHVYVCVCECGCMCVCVWVCVCKKFGKIMHFDRNIVYFRKNIIFFFSTKYLFTVKVKTKKLL